MADPTFDLVRDTLDRMANRHIAGLDDVFSCPPPCSAFAKAVVDSIEASGGPCPRVLGEESGVSLTFQMRSKKVYYIIRMDECDVLAISNYACRKALEEAE